MPRTEHKDFLGEPIKEGDFIAYTALWDRSPILKFGVVVRLKERENTQDYESGKRVSAATIGIISADRVTWNGFKRLDKYVWELQKDGKEITLGFCDRCIVVERRRVPVDVRDLLDAARLRRSP